MNIQDISRLHEHYARPTLVIEMPAELSGPSSMPPLPGTAGETGSMVLRRVKGSWRGIGLCLCLVIAAGFGGSFLGSMHKEPAKRESVASAGLNPDVDVDKPVSAERGADTPAPVAVAPVAVAAEAPLAAAPTSAAPIPASATPRAQSPASEPARTSPPRPIAAVQATAAKPPVKAEPAAAKAGSDVKMF